MNEVRAPEWIALGDAAERLNRNGIDAGELGRWIKLRALDARPKAGQVDGRPISEIPVNAWEEPIVNWRAGTLESFGKIGFGWRHIEAVGIEVRNDQLNRLAPLEVDGKQDPLGNKLDIEACFSTGGTTAPTLAAGASEPKKPEAWQAFWMALIELSQDGRLTPSQFPTQAKLIEEVREMIRGALGERTIKATVSQVYKKFIEPQKR